MDDKDIETTSAGIINVTSSVLVTTQDDPLYSGTVAVDYSPDDEDLKEAATAANTAAEATRDTLADGLVATLLKPCVERLDASVLSTRLSQLNLKLQLDSLATELKQLSLAQYDYLFVSTSLSLPQSSTAENTISTTSSDTTKTPTATDTCVLLDGYAQRLCGARAKIAVVGNILESTQERLRALSHRIGREYNNRRSLLEPQAVITSVAVEEPEVEINVNDEFEGNEIDIINKKKQKEQNENNTELDTDDINPQPVNNSLSDEIITTDEPLKLS